MKHYGYHKQYPHLKRRENKIMHEKVDEILANESDPNGKLSDESGAKFDSGKNRMGLVLSAFAPAIEQVCTVGTLGANKYSDNGWKTTPKGIDRYTDAMLRHYIKECQGEILDPELTEMNNGKEIYHASCVAWNALARLTLIIDEINGKEKESWRKVDESS